MKTKIFSLLVFCLIVSIKISAKDHFATMIEKFDVDDETLLLDNANPSDFWNSLRTNSMNVQDFFTNMEKNRGAEKETIAVTARLPRFDKKYRPEAIDELQPLCDSLFAKVGTFDKLDHCIVADETINAFTAFSSDGMIVALNIGLLTAKGISEPMLVGVMAHEYAHAVLCHQMRNIYDNIKRRKRNDILKGVSIALAAVGEGVNAYTDAVLGNEHSSYEFDKQIYSIEKSYHKDLLQYYFRYSRNLEYEADMIAYRFLEWSGYGGDNYIELLKLLGANDPLSYLDDDESEHPSISDRIAFIKYIKAHPEIKNSHNDKLKKKLQKKIEAKADKYADPLY